MINRFLLGLCPLTHSKVKILAACSQQTAQGWWLSGRQVLPNSSSCLLVLLEVVFSIGYARPATPNRCAPSMCSVPLRFPLALNSLPIWDYRYDLPCLLYSALGIELRASLAPWYCCVFVRAGGRKLEGQAKKQLRRQCGGFKDMWQEDLDEVWSPLHSRMCSEPFRRGILLQRCCGTKWDTCSPLPQLKCGSDHLQSQYQGG